MKFSGPDAVRLNEFCASENADVLVFAGGIRLSATFLLREVVSEGQANENLFLFLTSFGGVPDDAYRICRFLQRRYKHITVVIDSMCKSSGTLIALGGGALAMSETAELGPLDIQLAKMNEIGEEYSSGMVYGEALSVLRRETFDVFKYFAKQMKEDSGMNLSTKLAIDTAALITNGLFSPVFGQLDPVKLGENERDINIVVEYGQRLAEYGKNLKEDALLKLRGKYPSHSFVIDREEAAKLFRRVRPLNDFEIWVFEKLGDNVWDGLIGKRIFIQYLTGEVPANTNSTNPPEGGETDETSTIDESNESANGGAAPNVAAEPRGVA